MLFKNEELHSPYDFEMPLNEAYLDYGKLCEEIAGKIETMVGMIDDHEMICCAHEDEHNRSILIKSVFDGPSLRGKKDIRQILSRSPGQEQTSLSKYLEMLGIDQPSSEDPASLWNYYQLLYFLYMMNYIIFPQENFLLFLTNDKHITTELSPIEGSQLGKYWTFIIRNILDNEDASKKYVSRDIVFSDYMDNIFELLIKRFDVDNEKNHEGSYERTLGALAENVQNIIDTVAGIKHPASIKDSPLDKLLFAAYKHTFLAYAHDMLKNLDNSSLLQFSELDPEADIQWMSVDLKKSDLQQFFKRKDVVFFCKQNTMIRRPDKAIPANHYDLISFLMDYYISNNYNDCSFGITIDEQKEPHINGLDAAVILRTFYALIEDNARFLSFYKDTQKDWREEKKFKAALYDATSRIISDTPIRLFYIAYHTKRLNVNPNYGYEFHYLYRLSTPAATRLYFKVINAVFSGDSSPECRFRIQTAIDKLSDL